MSCVLLLLFSRASYIFKFLSTLLAIYGVERLVALVLCWVLKLYECPAKPPGNRANSQDPRHVFSLMPWAASAVFQPSREAILLSCVLLLLFSRASYIFKFLSTLLAIYGVERLVALVLCWVLKLYECPAKPPGNRANSQDPRHVFSLMPWAASMALAKVIASCWFIASLPSAFHSFHISSSVSGWRCAAGGVVALRKASSKAH